MTTYQRDLTWREKLGDGFVQLGENIRGKGAEWQTQGERERMERERSWAPKGGSEALRCLGMCIGLSVPLSLIIGGALLTQDPTDAVRFQQIRLLFVIVGAINCFAILALCCLDVAISCCLGGSRLVSDTYERRGSLELALYYQLFTRVFCFPLFSFFSLIFPVIEMGLGGAMFRSDITPTITNNIGIAAIYTGSVQLLLGAFIFTVLAVAACLAFCCGLGSGFLGYPLGYDKTSTTTVERTRPVDTSMTSSTMMQHEPPVTEIKRPVVEPYAR